jgi:hypothetical protein
MSLFCTKNMYRVFAFAISCYVSGYLYAAVGTERWADHPEWLWFDDFESGKALTADYQDVNTSGFSVVTTDKFSGSHSLCQKYTTGQVDAGWIIRVNNSGFPSHLFVRWYHKFDKDFSGFPPKMERMRYRPRTGDWKSVFAVHCWIQNTKVVADVSAHNSTQANSTGFLPVAISKFSFSDTANLGRWVCFESEVLLNTPGKKDGLYRMWADDSLIIERKDVDLRGTFNQLANEVMLDCYWNGGSPKPQNRYFDNFVISTQRIGQLKNTQFTPVVPAQIKDIHKKVSNDKPVMQVNLNTGKESNSKLYYKKRGNSFLLNGSKTIDVVKDGRNKASLVNIGKPSR